MPDHPPAKLPAPRSRFALRRRRRPASETLLRLYLSFQLTRAKVAGRAGASGAELAERCERTMQSLDASSTAQNPAWVEAYEVERELIALQSGAPLLQSLEMLLDRADAERAPAAVRLRRAYVELLKTAPTGAAVPPAGDAAAQGPAGPSPPPPEPPPAQPGPPPPPPEDALVLPLALGAIEAVQWSQAKRFESVPAKRDVVHRLAKSGLLAFALFILPYVWFDIAALVQRHVHGHDWSWLSLWTALTAGLLGAFFSRLLTVQKYFAAMSIDDVERVGDWNSILLRGGVGMIGALVVLVFLQSGIVSGKLFPAFAEIGFSEAPIGTATRVDRHLALPTASLALLVVWSFVAGFSERLVPRILAKTEKQLTEAATTDAGKAAG